MLRQTLAPRPEDVFFESSWDGSSYWTYMCSTKQKRTTTSYENLLSHVRLAHQDFRDLLSDSNELSDGDLRRFSSTATGQTCYGWFDIIIKKLYSFSAVQFPIMRTHAKDDPVYCQPSSVPSCNKKTGWRKDCSSFTREDRPHFWCTEDMENTLVGPFYYFSPYTTTTGMEQELRTFNPLRTKLHRQHKSIPI